MSAGVTRGFFALAAASALFSSVLPSCSNDSDFPPPLDSPPPGAGGRKTLPSGSGGRPNGGSGGAKAIDDAGTPDSGADDDGGPVATGGASGSGGSGGSKTDGGGGAPPGTDAPAFTGAVRFTRGKNAVVTAIATSTDGTTAFVGRHDGEAIVGLLAYDGKIVWELAPATPSAGTLTLNAVDRGAGGSVYVAGTLTDGHGDGDAYIAAYSSTGKLLWDRVLGSTSPDTGDSLGVDGNGRVYVVGESEGNLPLEIQGSGRSYVTRLNETGLPLWSERGTFSSVTSDGAGNAYVVAGASVQPPAASGLSFQALLGKFDYNGTKLWQKELSLPSLPASADFDHMEPGLVSVASGGAFVFVSAQLMKTGCASDCPNLPIIAKFSDGGAVPWSTNLRAVDAGGLQLSAISANDVGSRVFAVGSDLTYAVDEAGQAHEFAGLGSGISLTSVSADAEGDVVVAGSIETSAGTDLYFRRLSGEDGKAL